MRILLTLVAALPFLLQAQTTHSVSVFGGGTGNPAPSYSPQFITIDLGDIVQWNNSQGTHNVYGDLDIFPSNPAGFASGQPTMAPWNFSHTFNVAGFYEYHCTVAVTGFTPHSQTQFGSIMVIDPNSVAEEAPFGEVILYPMPVGDELFVDVSAGEHLEFSVLQHDGRMVRMQTATITERQRISLNGLAAGHYLLQITDEKGQSVTMSFIKSSQ